MYLCPMKIVFMGTAGFAVPSLKALHESEHDIIAVVTATDKPAGRGRKELSLSPVKQYAVANEIQVFQPLNLKDPRFAGQLKSLQADLFVVVAFRLLPEMVWSIPPKGTINLHGSLLPAYRGAAPINWAIVNGEVITGVTTFVINKDIDTGQILMQEKIDILPDDTAGTLHDRMMVAGAKVLLETVNKIAIGALSPIPQDETKVSHAPKIFKETCKIPVDSGVQQVNNFIRGMAPFPGAWYPVDDITEIKIYNAKTTDLPVHHTPGTFVLMGKQRLYLACADNYIEVLEVQLPGKRRMSTREMLNGSHSLFKV
jgi:methionyl-tRNA formyltransferase